MIHLVHGALDAQLQRVEGRSVAHFAFVAPPLAGHINPLLQFASELMARGHRATFVHQADVGQFVSGRGIAFAVVGSTSHPPGSLAKSISDMAKLGIVSGVRTLIRQVASSTDMLCHELPGVLQDIGADAVVADQMEAAGGLVSKYLGLPFVTTATGLPINRELRLPPPYVPWGYRTSLPWRRLNIGGWRVTNMLMRDVNRVIARHARRFGLQEHRRTEDCFSTYAQLAQCVQSLDFPRQELPDSFHYLGPFRRDGGQDMEFDSSDSRPLVYCSLGTIQGARVEIFRAVAEACCELNLQLLIAHGGRLAPEAARTLPGNPIVREFVPQGTVLARAKLAVTHAGFNTVLDALSFGVPMVALPLAFEQPATSARLVRSGVAEVLYSRHTPRRLRTAMERVLATPSYSQRARALASEIAASGGVKRAADITERVLGLSAESPHVGNA